MPPAVLGASHRLSVERTSPHPSPPRPLAPSPFRGVAPDPLPLWHRPATDRAWRRRSHSPRYRPSTCAILSPWRAAAGGGVQAAEADGRACDAFGYGACLLPMDGGVRGVGRGEAEDAPCPEPADQRPAVAGAISPRSRRPNRPHLPKRLPRPCRLCRPNRRCRPEPRAPRSPAGWSWHRPSISGRSMWPRSGHAWNAWRRWRRVC